MINTESGKINFINLPKNSLKYNSFSLKIKILKIFKLFKTNFQNVIISPWNSFTTISQIFTMNINEIYLNKTYLDQ